MSDVDEMTTGEQDKTTTGEQMEDWKKELALAMADQQWRRAIQFCSWLRYALWQQESADPEVEEALHRAKEQLAEQMAQEEKWQKHHKEHQQRRAEIMQQIASSLPKDALDSIEEFYRDGAHSQEIIYLLQELKTHFSHRLSSNYREKDRRAATFGRRVDELEERALDPHQ